MRIDAPPEWAGWISLIVLVGAFAVLAWWLLASPLPGTPEPGAPSEASLRMRRLLAGVVLLSGVLLRIGAPWDELWHRLYGVPFGQDLLWPPHLLLYASFTLSFVLVAYGLSVVLAGRSGLRSRFRREPLLAALGLLSAYGFAFIPVDIVWHQVIGPDLMAESPPHIVAGLSTAAVTLIGAALALSAGPRPSWRGILDRPRATDALALGSLAVLALNWLQLFTTGWEWADRSVLGRPGWMYPVTVLLIGTVVSHLALHATRRVGAATVVALLVLVAHIPPLVLYRSLVPPGPAIAAHLVLVPAAFALDIWYARRAGRELASTTRWGGSLVYAVVLLSVMLTYIGGAMTVPIVTPTNVLISVALGLPATVAVGLLAVHLGAWLAEVGRARARETSAVHPRGPDAHATEALGPTLIQGGAARI